MAQGLVVVHLRKTPTARFISPTCLILKMLKSHTLKPEPYP